ncbi:YfiT family bacillithiol transferase [Rhodohalobacter sulfatireducens]|uniref:Bacillithiol transferase BstA n=1 Tax=Rhodohalobacter sulfatireducens TaxID=2911366 RepID=A0ABS9K8X5_9BACT|nr:bacillithiol transferase BstA [Rhodohalobacter sulfatireducens]MCG2587310.1 bacillithiol transferase BstA [Rhodohalobacter sulfatireducens]
MAESVDIESLRYPVGKLNVPKDVSKEQISEWIDTIELFPSKVREITENLSEEELDWKYRPDGWTIRQVVHHVADSHMNSIIRFKLALTEEVPAIKPYHEEMWAELADSEAPISISLSLLDGLHKRWTLLLKSMSEDDFKRKLFHPEQGCDLTLTFMLGLYAWHCRHHLAHIKQGLESAGQF